MSARRAVSLIALLGQAHLLGCSEDQRNPSTDDEVTDSSADGPTSDAVPPCTCGTEQHVWILLDDLSEESSLQGTPGVDICGVEFECAGGAVGYGVEAVLRAGDGMICEAAGEDCLAARDDPNATLGPIEQACELASAPSQYVSLGLGGRLALRVAVQHGEGGRCGLVGCRLKVEELREPPGGEVPGSSLFRFFGPRLSGDICWRGSAHGPPDARLLHL